MTIEERKVLLEKAQKVNKTGAEWMNEETIKGDFDSVVGEKLHIENMYCVDKSDEKGTRQHYYLVSFREYPNTCFGTPTFLTNILDEFGDCKEDAKELTFIPQEKENIGSGKTYRSFILE